MVFNRPGKGTIPGKLAVFAFFSLAGLLGNHLKVELFYNVDYLFGSIFTFLAMRVLGPGWGVGAAAVSSVATYQLWNHPYAMIIATAEAAFVAALTRNGAQRFVLLDALYWATLGPALVWAFYYGVMGMEGNAVLLVMSKQAVNGIANCLTAELAFQAGLRFFRQGDPRARRSYEQVVFILLVSMVVYPGLVSTVHICRESLAWMEDEARKDLKTVSVHLNGMLDEWLSGKFRLLDVLGSETLLHQDNPRTIDTEIVNLHMLHPEFTVLGLCDASGTLYLSSASPEGGRVERERVDVSDRVHIRDVLRTHKPSVSDMFVSRIGLREPVVALGVPVAQGGKLVGVVVGSVSLATVTEGLADAAKAWGVRTTILGRQGQVVASTLSGVSPGEAFGRFEGGRRLDQGGGMSLWLKAPDPGKTSMQRWGESAFFVEFSPAGAPAWRVVVEFPVRGIMESLMKLARDRFLLLLFLILLTAGMAQLAGRLVAQPLRSLMKATSGLPEKVYSGRAVAWPDSTISEVSALVDDARGMEVSLREKFTELKNATVSLERARDEARAASEAKSLFLATMSHEIRTPLAGILGMAELASTTENSTERTQYMRILTTAARTLQVLVSDILDYSKIEAGKMTLSSDPIRLRELFGEVVELMEVPARDRGNTLALTVSPGVPATAAGDALRLKQILVNLVGNAVKFTRDGRVDIQAEYSPPGGDAPEGELKVQVRDTGIGIPPHKQAIVFDSFEQAREGGEQAVAGTGLGLAIVKRLTELMGGRVWVESEEGKGSTFFFTVRLRAAEPAPSTAPPGEGVGEPGGLTVLVAEDNKVNQLIARRFLERRGHTVLLADDGVAALGLLRENRVDCLLMDVQMPQMDGVKATQAIRAGEAGAGNAMLPIVGVTAHGLAGEHARFLEAGMDLVLAKPYDMEGLMTAVGQAIRGRRT